MKNHGERIARLEEAYIQSGEQYTKIENHLAKLNDSVATNTGFRLQGNATLKALGFVWVSVMIPLTAIAVAVLA